MKLVSTVEQIKGSCPAYTHKDKLVLDEGFRIDIKESTAACMHSLGAIMPFYNALAKGVTSPRLGLARPDHEDGRAQLSLHTQWTRDGDLAAVLVHESQDRLQLDARLALTVRHLCTDLHGRPRDSAAGDAPPRGPCGHRPDGCADPGNPAPVRHRRATAGGGTRIGARPMGVVAAGVALFGAVGGEWPLHTRNALTVAFVVHASQLDVANCRSGGYPD